MNDREVKQATAREWRALGFFYNRDDESKTWTMVGSRAGLLKLRDALRTYVADPRNAQTSEHEHYGPYMYLKVTTWPDPALDRDGIRGTLTELAHLAVLIETRLSLARSGDAIRIQDEYALRSPYALVLDVREDTFDPSAADPSLRT
jgi:hypothetical protein